MQIYLPTEGKRWHTSDSARADLYTRANSLSLQI